MALTPAEAQAHAHAPAVTCCRFEAGTVLGPEHLEDPTVFPALQETGFLQIPDDCLSIGEVLGATLQETLEGFTPLTPPLILTPSGLAQPGPPLSPARRPQRRQGAMVRTLLRQHVPITHVTLGPTTAIRGTTLALRQDICQEALHADPLVVDVQLDLIGPDRYAEYSHTIMDVQPIATKQEGTLGSGVTRVLDGVVAVVTGTDEHSVQIGEFGSSEGPMHRTIMWGRPGAPDPGDWLIKTNVTIKANTQMERPGPLAAHKAADVITQEIRRALKEADERCVVSTEELVHTRRPGHPKILIIKEIMGQGRCILE
jgi:D-proline reductase (dithiol) PrdA